MLRWTNCGFTYLDYGYPTQRKRGHDGFGQSSHTPLRNSLRSRTTTAGRIVLAPIGAGSGLPAHDIEAEVAQVTRIFSPS